MTTCPKCGCQTMDPFGMGIQVHDPETCDGCGDLHKRQVKKPGPDADLRELIQAVLDLLTINADLVGVHPAWTALHRALVKMMGRGE